MADADTSRIASLTRQARADASIAFLQAYIEGRPFEELRDQLPRELEATGQQEAASIVRSFFARADGTRSRLRSAGSPGSKVGPA
jgi:hypothetical protein